MITPAKLIASSPRGARRAALRLGLAAIGCGMLYAQAYYRCELGGIGSLPGLALTGSAITGGMTWLLVRRVERGWGVAWVLLAGVVGILLGVAVDVALHPLASTGGERNLFPLEAGFLAVLGLPGGIVGSLLGWLTRPGHS